MKMDAAMLELLLTTFQTEAQEICDALTRELLDIERLSPDDPAAGQAIREVSRLLHTLKGSAATVGLNDLAKIAHALEDLIAPLKTQPASAHRITDCVLEALDTVLVRLRAHVAKKGDGLGSPDDLVDRIRQLTAKETPTAEPLAAAPVSEAPDPKDEDRSKHEPVVDQPTTIQTTWRVDANHVLSLMTQVDRLREVALRLAERRREFNAVTGTGAAPRDSDHVTGFKPITMDAVRASVALDGEETNDIVSSLEEGIKAICTMPIQSIIDPLYRTVRDVAQNCGKEVRLSVVGAELAFDRRALDALRGPLVHLVRNAVDHGIEPPDVREQRGKHRMGLITIRVERQGNMAFLEIEDDGAGLDLERVRAVALERGLFSAEALVAMDPFQLQQLTFNSGFSTRSQVNEVSGRGLGLDVVKSALLKLNGNVEFQSRNGQGCKFVLTLPVEMGSSPALLIRCLEDKLGIPMLSVESAIAIRRDVLRRVRDEARLPFRDGLIPLWDLSALLGMRGTTAFADGQTAIIIGSRGQYAAIAVDEVIGDRELAIRALPSALSILPAYQGASMLAQGELVLILNPNWLVDPERGKSSQLVSSRSVLVVDDSMTARALHRSVLEAGGYLVHTASSASQALEALGRTRYEVMVCDIAMEGLDGIGLTSLLRSRPDTRTLPIILVSAREGPDDRRQGLEAGADGYLTKGECAQGRLLREIAVVLEKGRRS